MTDVPTANQWTDFYMIATSIMKNLITQKIIRISKWIHLDPNAFVCLLHEVKKDALFNIYC